MEHSSTVSSEHHHLVDQIILPLEAWTAVIIHYSYAQLPLVDSRNDSTFSTQAYLRSHSKELDNLTVHYESYSNRLERRAQPAENHVNVQIFYPSRKYCHKRFRLCEFAARYTLLVRALLLETLDASRRNTDDVSASISRWPQFIQMLLLRIVLHRFSTPWSEDSTLNASEPSTTAARAVNGLAKLHVVLDWILRVSDEDSATPTHCAVTPILSSISPPLWLLRHIDMTCTNDALSMLMHTRHEWNEYGAQNNSSTRGLEIQAVCTRISGT